MSAANARPIMQIADDLGAALERTATALVSQYAAFRVSSTSTAHPLEINVKSLDAAVHAAVLFCQHKDVFVVVETDPRRPGVKMTHWYAVKRKSTPRYVYRDYQTHRVHDHYPDHIFSLAMKAFEPEHAYDWTQAKSHWDIMGVDPTEINGAALAEIGGGK